MTQKIEQWMTYASRAICKAWDVDTSAVEWGAEIIASHAPSNDWPYIREQFRIEFGVEMETRYGGEIMNLVMSIRTLLNQQPTPAPKGVTE